MARKRKKRATARARRRREPVELEQPVEPPTPAEEWGEVVEGFREMLQLESRTARRQVLRLMSAPGLQDFVPCTLASNGACARGPTYVTSKASTSPACSDVNDT